MRGGYGRQITERPGKCGGCKNFVRRVVDGKLTAGGKCAKKPGMWQAIQSMTACKKALQAEGGGQDMTPIYVPRGAAKEYGDYALCKMERMAPYSLDELLTEAVQKIQGQYAEIIVDDPETGEAQDTIPADPEYSMLKTFGSKYYCRVRAT